MGGRRLTFIFNAVGDFWAEVVDVCCVFAYWRFAGLSFLFVFCFLDVGVHYPVKEDFHERLSVDNLKLVF